MCGSTRFRSSQIFWPGWRSGVPNSFVTASLTQYAYCTGIESCRCLRSSIRWTVTFDRSGLTFSVASGSPIAETEKKISTLAAKSTGTL